MMLLIRKELVVTVRSLPILLIFIAVFSLYLFDGSQSVVRRDAGNRHVFY